MKCIRCNKEVSNEFVTLYNEKVFCSNCARLFGSCLMCEHFEGCSFSDEAIDIPPFVMQTVQHGPVKTQIQVANPKRIEATCLAHKCSCFDKKEHKCMRGFGVCDNYKEIEF